MSKAALLFSSFWSDRDNRQMPAPAKLLFLFLMSYNADSGGSVSGVYHIEIEDMAYWTGIPADVIKALLQGKEIEVAYKIKGESKWRSGS